MRRCLWFLSVLCASVAEFRGFGVAVLTQGFVFVGDIHVRDGWCNIDAARNVRRRRGARPNVLTGPQYLTPVYRRQPAGSQRIDLPAGAKIAGSGFPLYRGAGAALQRALIDFFLELHTREHGLTEIWPPAVVRKTVRHLPVSLSLSCMNAPSPVILTRNVLAAVESTATGARIEDD